MGATRGDWSITTDQLIHRTRLDDQTHQAPAKSGGAKAKTISSVRSR